MAWAEAGTKCALSPSFRLRDPRASPSTAQLAAGSLGQGSFRLGPAQTPPFQR